MRCKPGLATAVRHCTVWLDFSEVQCKGDNVTAWLRGELTSKMLRRELRAPPADVLWDVLVLFFSFFLHPGWLMCVSFDSDVLCSRTQLSAVPSRKPPLL